MAFTLDFSLSLGTSKAGIADLRAQLIDTSGTNVGSAVSTGFTEVGQGFYLWHYAAFPDGHRGGVKFYSAAASSTVLAFAAVNPEEAEYADAKTTSRLAPTTAGRTLDVSTGGEAGIDWANVGTPGATVDLSGTTVSTVSGSVAGNVMGSVGYVLGDVQGTVFGGVTVGNVGVGAITESSFTLPAESGVPSGILSKLVWIASRLGLHKVTKTGTSSGSIVVKKSDGTTTWTTNTFTSSGGTDDIGAAS